MDTASNVFIRGRWIVFRAAEGETESRRDRQGEWMSHLFLPLPCRPESMGTISSPIAATGCSRMNLIYQFIKKVKETLRGAESIVTGGRKG